MPLLFAVSGVATAFALQRLSPVELRQKRSRQLLPPFVLGVFILVPPQLYVYFNATAGIPMSMAEVFARYLTFTPFDLADGSRVLMFKMEHLWYLAYLWAYTAILVAFIETTRLRLSAMGGWLAARLRGYALLIWPALLFTLVRITLRPLFPPTISLLDDWYSHLIYMCCFAGGAILAHSEEFWQQLARMRLAALLVVLICLPMLIHQLSVTPLSQEDEWNSLAANLVLGPFRWCMMVAILGYAQMLRSWRPAALTYLNGAVLAHYVLHQPVMLLIAYWLHAIGALTMEAFVPIVVLTLAVNALIYEGWRRLSALLARPAAA